MITRLLTEHPNSVGESYGEHMLSALSFAGWMALAAVLCLCHALLPWLFCRSGSAIIERLHNRMVVNRAKVAKPNASLYTGQVDAANGSGDQSSVI